MVSATMPEDAVDSTIRDFLDRSGLARPAGKARLAPLTGGVASDIFRVDTADRTFVVKKALPSLRVAQEWHAPVSRNESEVKWFLEAQRVVPHAVPEILAHDPVLGVFAMTYLEPANHPVWKDELREGRADPAFAAAVGQTIAAIHNATANVPDVAQRFANDDTFQAIRLEPYLEATARRHDDLAEELLSLSKITLEHKVALVHGDVSPKNILVGPVGPVVLDAECAWYGEPAFDLAFCLNHLLLKCVWKPQNAERYLQCFDALSTSYLSSVRWEAAESMEARTARLLPALFLGRIDGKSPAEYITAEADKERVRRAARQMIQSRTPHLSDIRQSWARETLN